jgi:hypothetical protein
MFINTIINRIIYLYNKIGFEEQKNVIINNLNFELYN